MDYIMLPCSNEYSMIVLYDNPFDIISVIYNLVDLHEHVLTHVKSNRRYYTVVSNNYLNKKKTGFGELAIKYVNKEIAS